MKPGPPNQRLLNASGPDEDTAKRRMAGEEIPRELREQTKYRVLRLLGRGGMGSVYEAHHERMDRRVAIKTINPNLIDHPEALKRFDQEVKAAAKLDHANVARAYDADEFGSLRVLVMEFVPGQSLDKLLLKRGQLSVVEACRLVRQAMVGLEHAYQRGMVHRDLKPQNLMLTPDGKVKILDFGLAKVASECPSIQGLTRDNAIMGTPHYLAPEQALDAAKADIRADIYSLGCTLFCLLAGTPPFNGDTEMKVLLAHQTETPSRLCERRSDVPKELSDLVDRLLAKNPADRPQTPRAVADALQPFAKGEFKSPDANPLAFLENAVEEESPQPSDWSKTARTPVQPRDFWWRSAGAAAVFFTLIIGAWALGMFVVSTPAGMIIVENLPADVDVQIDGDPVTLSRNGDVTTIASVGHGGHQLKFVRVGKEIWSSGVTIDSSGPAAHVKYAGRDPSVTAPPPKQPSPTVTVASPPAKPPSPTVAVAKSPSPAVEVFDGTWFADGETLVQSSTADGRTLVIFGDPAWSRYNIDLQGQVLTGGHRQLGVYFNVADVNNFRFFGLGGYGGDWYELATVFETQSLAEGRQMLEGEFQRNRWYHLRIEVRGADCRCLLDGKDLFGNSEIRLQKGRIGLSGWSTPVSFKDILVTDEDGKVLWKGPPPLPTGAEMPVAPQPDQAASSSWTQARYPQAEIVNGSWKIVGEELLQTSLASQNSALAFGDPSWSNYNLTLRAKADEGWAGFAIGWNVKDPASYRVLRVAWRNNTQHELAVFIDGVEKEMMGIPAVLDRTQWHDVRIEVRGAKSRCLMDGKLLFDKDESRLTAGRIGLGGFSGTNRFKDIVVTSADDKTVLWKGLPKLLGVR